MRGQGLTDLRRVSSGTGGDILLQLLLQEVVDQLLAGLHLVLKLCPLLVQLLLVLGGLVLHRHQGPPHPRLLS